MNIIQELATNETLPMADKLQGALVVTLLGVSITFIVLVLLLFIIKSMEFIFKPAPVKTESQPVQEAAPVVDQFITEEEVAAVTAAIIAHTNKKNIIISSIREIKPSWRNAAKLEQLK
jgi:sodium pump decarboxylase gamma subunit